MKPESLKLLKRNLHYLSDDDLAQFCATVLDELRRRAAIKRWDRHLNGFWQTKDCEPIRGY